MSQTPTITIERPDDEHLEVHINGRPVAEANYDEHGWTGMDAVEKTAIGVARACGARVDEGDGDTPPDTTAPVLAEVAAERRSQDEQWGEQNHPDGTARFGQADRELADASRRLCKQAADLGLVTWRHILDEEMREVFAEGDPVKLRAELVQVAAVAVAWVEAIDRRTQAVEA